MTVREYIGARYVPLFIGDWDIDDDYEPLSVVNHQGNSYTSRQAVPHGIEITNEQYWIETGNYNAQVEAYRQEVLQYNDRISTLEGYFPIGTTSIFDDAITTAKIADDAITTAKILDANVTTDKLADSSVNSSKIEDGSLALTDMDSDFQELLSGIGDDISGIENDIDLIQAEIGEITTKSNIYSYFKGHKMVVIGDSYAYGTGASDHGSGDTNRFSTILANRLQATEINCAVGSTGFCDPGSSGQNKPFPTQIDDIVSDMTQSDRSLVHLVLITGGINDFREGATYSASQLETAAASCCEKAANGFPNALILVVPMLFNGMGADPRMLNFERAIINGVEGNSGHRRTVCIKGAWTWNFGLASHYANDKLHPNDLGHRNFANRIYANILGGECYADDFSSIDWESGFSSSVANGGYIHLLNGAIYTFGMIVNLASSLGAGTTTKIGTVSPCAVPLVNISVPIMKGNAQKGIAIVTNSGAFYIHADEAIADLVYIAPFSYIPMGSY